MKKILTIILVLCSVASFGQMRGGAQYDPGAARKNLSNVDASATPSMTSITLSGKVRAAWADILGDIYASGTVKVGAGTAAAPAYTFSTDPDTGIYSPGANVLGLGVGGVAVASLSSTGLSLASPLAVANGGTGATTAAAGLAALGGASLNGSSTVAFSASTLNSVTLLTSGGSTPIADSGSITMQLNPITNSGFLSVTQLRYTNEGSWTTGVYAVGGFTPTWQISEIASFSNALGSTFVPTISSGGLVTITNTSGVNARIRATYMGHINY